MGGSVIFKVLFQCYQILLEAQRFPSLLSASPPHLPPSFQFFFFCFFTK